MSDLTFEQRHRLETEVLPAVIGDPEYAAATIVRLEAERDRLREALVEIINTPNKSEGESAETLSTMMQDIAFAALEDKK